jgi:hypothetical protein
MRERGRAPLEYNLYVRRDLPICVGGLCDSNHNKFCSRGKRQTALFDSLKKWSLLRMRRINFHIADLFFTCSLGAFSLRALGERDEFILRGFRKGGERKNHLNMLRFIRISRRLRFWGRFCVCENWFVATYAFEWWMVWLRLWKMAIEYGWWLMLKRGDSSILKSSQ